MGSLHLVDIYLIFWTELGIHGLSQIIGMNCWEGDSFRIVKASVLNFVNVQKHPSFLLLEFIVLETRHNVSSSLK